MCYKDFEVGYRSGPLCQLIRELVLHCHLNNVFCISVACDMKFGEFASSSRASFMLSNTSRMTVLLLTTQFNQSFHTHFYTIWS